MIEVNARRFQFVRGSDIHRDGMYLELLDVDAQTTVAEVFYADATKALTFSAYERDLPLEAIEALIDRGKKLLTPSTSS